VQWILARAERMSMSSQAVNYICRVIVVAKKRKREKFLAGGPGRDILYVDTLTEAQLSAREE
jgi:hypothetical protein